MTKYNYRGEILTGEPQLKSSYFGFTDDKGRLMVKWKTEDEYCDKNGFDKSYRPDSSTTDYVIKDFIIPKGTVICRYGSPRGRFSTYKGTDYDTLSLPYIRETIDYHEYIVTTYLKVVCIVTKGITAPHVRQFRRRCKIHASTNHRT